MNSIFSTFAYKRSIKIIIVAIAVYYTYYIGLLFILYDIYAMDTFKYLPHKYLYF